MGTKFKISVIGYGGLWTVSLPVVAWVLVGLSLRTYSLADQPACYPSDYSRIAEECVGGATRKVTYDLMRNCTPQFNFSRYYEETCECTPNDFVSDFSYNTVTNSCSLVYTPFHCEGNISAPILVDSVYCEVEAIPCTANNTKSTYTQCDPATKSIGLVYYFDDKCNPMATGSVHLPPSSYMDCNTHCTAGTFLSGTKCENCTNGTFSIGGGMRFQGFTVLDNSTFKTTCSYVGRNGTTPCNKNKWRVDGLSLKVGPFDSPNQMFQDECDKAKSDCHNGLTAALIMDVKLVRHGFVKFNFSVNSEKDFDGISFHVDDVTIMPLKSFTLSVEQKLFELDVGYHKLSWIYTKDEKWTSGKDTAVITLIEVDGTDFNDRECTLCNEGYYSEAGASTCIPCPVDTYTNMAGQAQCTPCDPDSYAASMPRTNCTIRPDCDLGNDATILFGSCMAGSHTRIKTYSWLQPQICNAVAGFKLPKTNVTCGECPVGQRYVDNSTDGTRTCQLCPAGSAKGPSEADCKVCGSGKAAVRELSLAHFTLLDGKLPDGFTTGCNGECGSFGWRAVNDYLDSGSGHGNTVSVWLALNVTLEMDGWVKYNFSVDITESDTERGFFFYVDEELVDDWQADDDYDYEGDELPEGAVFSDPYNLGRGSHSLMWVWVKLNADPSLATKDSAIIYEILVKGEVRGGAAECVDVPEGSMLSPGGTSYEACSPGMYSLGKTSRCLPCPANTYNPVPGAGKALCLPCNPGTSSLENSTDCFVGDITEPSSFCTYSPPSSNTTEDLGFTLYDLSPLSRLHADRMFGPVYDNATDPAKEDKAVYYASICDMTSGQSTCVSVVGSPLDTYLCKVWAKSPYDAATKRRPASNLGKTVSLLPFSSDPQLNRRGLIMEFTGDSCPFVTGKVRRTGVITFVCDPSSGYGQPEAWTTEAKITVFDPATPFPWVNRNGSLVPVENASSCVYSMVWYSAYACPMCAGTDYEAVDLQGCVGNKRSTHRLKDPKMCQVNPLAPFPPDVLCDPCTKDDIVVESQHCLDSNGDKNVSYRWKQPLLCSPNLPNSAKLPADFVAGPCSQNVTIVNPTLKRVEWSLAAGGVFLLIILSIVSGVMYVRSQKIYSAYSKLVQSERLGELEMEGVDGPEPEENMNVKLYTGRLSSQ